MLSPVAFRASMRPSVILLALVAVSAAGCSSDTSRFEGPFSNPFASRQQAAPAEVTGSISSAPRGQIQSQPLPAPGQTASAMPPATRPATIQGSGVAGGGRGMASYQPGSAPQQDITGSVNKPAPAPAWNWEGGTPVTVGPNDTLDTLSKRHNIPASVIMQANGVSVPPGIHPGQRLVIPRYTQSTAPVPVASASRSVVGQAESGTHTVVPGETMIGIAKRYNVALKDLAKANRVEPYAQLKMGDRLVIPGRAAAATAKPPVLAAKPAPVAPAPTTKLAAAPQQKMAAVDTTQSAHSVKPTQDVAVDEPKGSASGTAAFRWPVRGRIIAGFGPKPNGQQNDGINLSVPEGTPIKAAEDGVVAYSGNELKGYGNLVLIRHSNGFVTAYAHASELLVKRGDTIKRGQTIAKAGQTGTVTSPQVHFEIRKGSSPVDPTQYLNGA